MYSCRKDLYSTIKLFWFLWKKRRKNKTWKINLIGLLSIDSVTVFHVYFKNLFRNFLWSDLIWMINMTKFDSKWFNPTGYLKNNTILLWNLFWTKYKIHINVDCDCCVDLSFSLLNLCSVYVFSICCKIPSPIIQLHISIWTFQRRIKRFVVSYICCCCCLFIRFQYIGNMQYKSEKKIRCEEKTIGKNNNKNMKFAMRELFVICVLFELNL